MTGNFTRAAILVLAALAAGSGAYAEGRDPYPASANAAASNGKTRAEVQAELAQAQRAGFSNQLQHNWSGERIAASGQRSRADVRLDAGAPGLSTSALERAYPAVR